MNYYFRLRIGFIGCAILYLFFASFGSESTSGSEERSIKENRQSIDSLRHIVIEIDKTSRKNVKEIGQNGTDIDSLKMRTSELEQEVGNISKSLNIEKNNIIHVKEYSESESEAFKHIILQRTWAIGSAIFLLILIGIAAVVILQMRIRIKDKLIVEKIDFHKDKAR